MTGKSHAVDSSRSRQATTYANPDGTQTTILSTEPVNYRDSHGTWRAIQPDLRATSTGDLTAIGGGTPAELAQHADSGQLAQLSVDATHRVSWRMQTRSHSKAVVSGSSAHYRNVGADSDLELKPQAAGLKETIVLRSRQAATRYKFALSLTGLRAQVSGAGV
ncbi:MAG: hypothetical protein INR66_24555, partial [Gordonia polyisoprenivorans]|nr:hypothetical protein [Gordonia polyisoprenivorans]